MFISKEEVVKILEDEVKYFTDKEKIYNTTAIDRTDLVNRVIRKIERLPETDETSYNRAVSINNIIE